MLPVSRPGGCLVVLVGQRPSQVHDPVGPKAASYISCLGSIGGTQVRRSAVKFLVARSRKMARVRPRTFSPLTASTMTCYSSSRAMRSSLSANGGRTGTFQSALSDQSASFEPRTCAGRETNSTAAAGDRARLHAYQHEPKVDNLLPSHIHRHQLNLEDIP